MEITGKLIGRTGIEEGQSAKGPWKKRTIIIETLERHPQRIAFECWNDNVEITQNMAKEQIITIDFDLSSRDYNGKWYTSAKVYRFKNLEQQQPAQPVQPNPYVKPQYAQGGGDAPDYSFENDNLPF